MLLQSLHTIHNFTCITCSYIKYTHYIHLHALRNITCITCVIILRSLHTVTLITYITYVYMLYALAPLHNLHTVTWQTELALTLNIILSTPHPPRAPALPTDPSLSMEILSAALHAGPDVYHKAVAAWRAKFPVTVLPDPGKDFLICEGSSWHDQGMCCPANFSRLFA
jgi:hypothetical protein